MSLTRASINNPYGVIALSLVVVALGVFAFFRTPTDLFPDTAPPQVAVITVEPGAAADDISDKITRVIEKEVNTISGLKRIRATSRDEVSALTAEFYYTKNIGEAVTDVQNAVARIRAKLPRDILEPQIYRITDATKALMTIALSPKPGSPKSLAAIRLLAENEITDDLLRVPGVGDVDIFGANMPEVQVRVNRDKLRAYNLPLPQVLAAIAKQNVAAPAGIVYTSKGEYLVRVKGEFANLDDILNQPLNKSGNLFLKDVATVEFTTKEARSGYLGNSKKAIAINVMRPEGGKTVFAIKNTKREIKRLMKRYPDINFELTNDQQPIIDVNIKGMRSSVYQAVLLTVLIILVFLADVRAALAISLSIPMAFLSALMVLWFSPYTLNMVTLSGVIIAVGMVVDASIVVLEIIYRKHKEEPNRPIKEVTIEGAEEIFHGVTAGVFTTVIVLVPVMFTGGYTQQVFRPLNMMITATILSSLVAAFTIVPLVAIRLLSKKEPGWAKLVTRLLTPFTNWMDRRTIGVTNIAKWLLKHRRVAIVCSLPPLIFSMRVVRPMNGQELMPPMDTGIGIVKFDTPTEYSPVQTIKVAENVEKMLRNTSEGLKLISTTIGSEPGQISFGGGGETAQSVTMLVTLVDRKHRKASIWEQEKRWRAGLREIDGVRTFAVTEYGATPMSTTKAPLDIVIAGPDTKVLDRLADETMKLLKSVRGLTDVRRSWYIDKREQNIKVDRKRAAFYGLNPADIALLAKTAIKGVPVSSMRLQDALDIPIIVKYDTNQVNRLGDLNDILLPSPYGPIPLRTVAKVSTELNAPFITREDLRNTIDITGINAGLTIKQVGQQVKPLLKKLKVPRDYTVYVSGTLADMKQGGKEMGRALAIGVVLLYILLVWMYKSFIHPVTIMLSILLPLAAGMWGLLLFHKPLCKPAMMGMILLAGTVVNNAILLLDFILTARANGMSKDEAIAEAVRLRFRPIVMTAASTAIGLTPLVFQLAVGMERMSPLAIVAAFGLLVGIFTSCWIYPVIYSLFDSATETLKGKSTVKATTGVTTTIIIGLLLSTGTLSAAPLTNAAEFCACSDNTNSTTTSRVPVFSLEQAVSYALEHSPRMRISQADTAASMGEEKSAKANLLPQISLTGNIYYSKEDHPVIPGLSPMEVRFSDTTYDAGVELRQLIYDFGQTANRLKAARLKTLAAENAARRTRDEVIYTVTALYHRRMMTDDLMASARASEKAIAKLVDNIEKRHKVGKASTLDLHKARVRLAEIKSRLALIAATRTNTQSSLAAAMGYSGPDFRLEKMPDSSDTRQPDYSTELLNKALAQRGDMLALTAAADAAEAAAKSAADSRWPVISAFGQYAEYGASNPEPGNPLGNTDDGWQDNYFVGLQLRMPLFDSGLRSGQIESARAKQLQAQARLNSLALNVEQELRYAIAEIKSARMRVEAYRSSVAEAALAFNDEEKKYAVGKSTINNLLDAEAAKLAADSQLSQATHELAIAIANLKLVLGEQ